METIGILNSKIVSRYKIKCESHDIKIHPGVIKHIQKRHPKLYQKYSANINSVIQSIIEFPDYVGQHPKEPGSVEMVKMVDEHLLLAIKLDESGYLFISSLYDVSEYKVNNRVNSQRLVSFDTL